MGRFLECEEGDGHKCPPPHGLPTLSPSYELQLRGAAISLSGCSQECWKDVVQKACCPGYWGSQCFGMDGRGCLPCPSHPMPQLPILI